MAFFNMYCMWGWAQQITVRICEFVMNTIGKTVAEISQVYLKAGWKELTKAKKGSSSAFEGKRRPYSRQRNDHWVQVQVVLFEKFVFSETYEKVSVAGSHFRAHGYTIGLFAKSVTEFKTVESQS